MPSITDSRAFNRLLSDLLAGRLTRREVMVRATALGLSAASLPTLSTVAAASTAMQDAATPQPGGILKVGLQADPTALDPHKQSLTAIWHVVEHIYNRLTRIQPDLTVGPELAESWDISDDGLVYTFNLRQGVTFHNGRPMVAEDVVYSFERLVDPETASTSAADLASMGKVEAPDELTVVMTLKAPDASLLATLSGQSTIIIPREVVEENGDLSQVAVGTGPFIFKEYVPNTRIVLEKNPNYWEEGLPYLDGMELTPITEDTSRTTALVTGTVDFIEYAPLRDIEVLEQDGSLKLAGDENTNVRFIGLNVEREPFNNLQVRQAIAKVIDREAVLGPAVFGHGTPTEILFPDNFWAALEHEPTPPDIEGAKALLAEAGYPDGFETSITSWSAYSFLSNAAVVVQEQLKQIGIEAELNLVENATMVDQVYIAKDFDIAVTGESAYVDPNTLIQSNFGTGESGNFVNYSNERVDELIVEGMAATDQTARQEIYQEIQRILLEDLPWVNLFIANQFEAMKDDVMGYTHIPTGSNISLRETWLDR